MEYLAKSSRRMGRNKNYAMMKLTVPKRVTLPNGRTFVAGYKRIPRGELPPNIVMRGTYAQRAAPRGRRRRQRGRRIFDFVKKKSPETRSLNHLQKKVSNTLREFIIT